MGMLSTREAAAEADVTVRQWHWLVEKHGLVAVRSLPGIRGAKFWDSRDVARIKRLIKSEGRAA